MDLEYENEQIACAFCGKMFVPKSWNMRFCCTRCNSNYHYRKRQPKKDSTCRYNDGACCQIRKCGSCGWNPANEQKRLKALGVTG